MRMRNGLRKKWTGWCCLLLSGCIFAVSNNEGIQVYQKNLHLYPERKQSLANDIYRYHNADNIWNLLRKQFTLPHYEKNPLVQSKIDWFLNHQDYLLRSMTRAAPYLYFILQQAKKRHLPAELVLLPIIESAYNPFALNASSGAAGMWQMMSATASGYGIRQNNWYDGRRDAVASTKAALSHLAYLQSFFEGNWLLAIAAYDTGEGNVLAAIRKNINRGENTDFWSLPVAQETRDYVPQLLALAIIISHPDQYPIEYPEVPNAPYLAQVDIGTQIDLREAASLAGLSLKELKQLNSGYSRTAMDPNGPYKIVLPIENVEQFTKNLSHASFYAEATESSLDGETLPAKPFKIMSKKKTSPSFSNPTFSGMMAQPLDNTVLNDDTAMVMAKALNDTREKYSLQPGDTLYMVRQGDTLNKIATHFHMESKKIASINQVTESNPLYPGQSIIVPTHSQKQTTSPPYALSPGDTIYMVRLGDTIEKIAEKFHTTPAAVRVTNLLGDNSLEVGDQLVIPTHV